MSLIRQNEGHFVISPAPNFCQRKRGKKKERRKAAAMAAAAAMVAGSPPPPQKSIYMSTYIHTEREGEKDDYCKTHVESKQHRETSTSTSTNAQISMNQHRTRSRGRSHSSPLFHPQKELIHWHLIRTLLHKSHLYRPSPIIQNPLRLGQISCQIPLFLLMGK